MADEIGYFLLGCFIISVAYTCILRPLFALGDIPKELERIRDELKKNKGEWKNGNTDNND